MLRFLSRPASIFEHVRRHINPNGPGLLPGGEKLPDEADLSRREGLRMVGGLADQLSGPDDQPSLRVEQLLGALAEASRDPDRKRSRRLERLLATDDCMRYIDQLGHRIQENPLIKLERVRPLVRDILLRTGRRGAVKYAIALLGYAGDPADLELYPIIGRHEEFTLYAAVALANTLDDPLENWFQLAQQVSGWGKIDLITRICERNPQSEGIRHWLLRSGCENAIMNEYLGLVVAQGADLLGSLREPDPDAALLRGAGIILAAMTEEAPAPGFSEYPEGPEAVRLFLTHLMQRQSELQGLEHVGTLRRYLKSPECTWADRADLVSLAVQVIALPHWPALVLASLANEDRQQAWYAWRGARLLGIEIFEDLRLQLRERPFDQGLWFELLRGCDTGGMELVLHLAHQLLPLDEICSGPKATDPLERPNGTPDACLDMILQGLGHFPGLGSDLLIRALRSRDTMNRTMALSALEDWPAEWITEEIRQAVEASCQSDPSDRVAAEALSGWDAGAGASDR